ncbi:MAG TPA: tripartite tricarboxylate transporter substrate binding protein [Burkholderiales bacterium]|nr:tripartite tricarboxylate transporter substrate binding protein [Burkholderiales bacterium]
MRLLSFAVMLTMYAFATSAQTQNYPSRPIRFIVPFPPGGGNDVMARIVGQKFTDAFGQQVVIDNRGGAGGNIGTEIASRAAPDGYTLFLGGVGSHGTNPGLQSKLPYDPVKDFAPVSQIASAALVVVSNLALPAKSISELVQYAQSRPGQINYASSGTGSIAHLSVELFNSMAKIKLQHVPYKGTGPALTDLLSGQVQLLFNSALSMLPQIRGNRVRALAVTSVKRIAPLPDVPTIAESGLPGYDATSWYGVLAPARTPRTIIDKLNAEIVRAVRAPELSNRLQSEGALPVGNSPEQFAAFIQRELDRWAKVIKEAGIKVE